MDLFELINHINTNEDAIKFLCDRGILDQSRRFVQFPLAMGKWHKSNEGVPGTELFGEVLRTKIRNNPFGMVF